jgi:FMN reductase
LPTQLFAKQQTINKHPLKINSADRSIRCKPRNPRLRGIGTALAQPGDYSLLAEQLFKKELIMTRPLKVVAVSGGTWRPSRTLVLTQAILAQLAEQLPIESKLIELGDISRPLGAALSRQELSADIEAELQAIENADLLIVAAPVYRGSYPGLLKHLFDLIDLNALINTPVLLAATGGSERHALVLDHQLRPLFSFFQALTLPIGVYATEADFSNYQITSELLKARIQLAAERAAPLFGVHPNNLLKIA